MSSPSADATAGWSGSASTAPSNKSTNVSLAADRGPWEVTSATSCGTLRRVEYGHLGQLCSRSLHHRGEQARESLGEGLHRCAIERFGGVAHGELKAVVDICNVDVEFGQRNSVRQGDGGQC